MTPEQEIKKLEWKINNECMSDQEIEEILSKIEQLKLQMDESKPEVKAIQNEQAEIFRKEIQKTPRQKRSIYEVLRERYFPKKEIKPATMDEVHQLKIDYQKARLERMVAEEKERTPKKIPAILKIIRSLNSQGGNNSTPTKSKKRYNPDTDDFANKLRKLTGNSHSDRDFKKAFWG